MDAGRPGRERPASKQAWIRKRKEAVDKAAQEEEELITPQRRQPPEVLAASLEKESRRQVALEKKRKAEALVEGTLLDKEVTQDLEDEARKRCRVDAANDRLRARKFGSINAQLDVRMKKQTQGWALQGLPSPAILLGAAHGNATKAKLRGFGVSAFVEDRTFLLLLFAYYNYIIITSYFSRRLYSHTDARTSDRPSCSSFPTVWKVWADRSWPSQLSWDAS